MTTTAPEADVDAPTGAPAPAQVLMFQPYLMHYRLPIWDRVIELADGRYEFRAVGPMADDGEVFGGGTRPYLGTWEHRTHRLPVLPMFSWPGALEHVRREKPEVVVTMCNPRNFTCWQLAKVVKSYGGCMVAWAKVHSYAGLPPAIVQPIKRRFFKRHDLIMVYGRQSERELQTLGYPADRIRVVQNTIDTRRIFEDGEMHAQRGVELRAERGLTDKKILLMIGRMDPVKRHSDMLDAWPRLRALDDDLVMVIVGHGQLLDEVRTRAGEVDPDRIICTGKVPEGEDYSWIATADLTLYPGAVGLAINQSMAFGKPTIIADEYGADSEILEHDVTGWRYRRGDIDALVGAVRHVLETPDEVARVTDTARVRMRDEVTIENMAQSMHAAYLEAIAIAHERQGRAR